MQLVIKGSSESFGFTLVQLVMSSIILQLQFPSCFSMHTAAKGDFSLSCENAATFTSSTVHSLVGLVQETSSTLFKNVFSDQRGSISSLEPVLSVGRLHCAETLKSDISLFCYKQRSHQPGTMCSSLPGYLFHTSYRPTAYYLNML